MNQEQLRDLYKIAIEEYRFQVNLNWDRTKFYLGLNLTLIGVAAGLVRFAQDWQTRTIAAAIFFIGIFTALAGRQALVRGHKYYRQTILRKTQLEAKLELLQSGMTIATTPGQQEAQKILQKPQEWANRPLRTGSITFWLATVFIMLVVFNLVGVCIAVSR